METGVILKNIFPQGNTYAQNLISFFEECKYILLFLSLFLVLSPQLPHQKTGHAIRHARKNHRI